jgi:hypothetical protein
MPFTQTGEAMALHAIIHYSEPNSVYPLDIERVGKYPVSNWVSATDFMRLSYLMIGLAIFVGIELLLAMFDLGIYYMH